MSAAPDITLYGYFRSSAAFRVRIALNLKAIKPTLHFVHLLKDGGQQHAADYQALNPQQLIPTLAHDGHTIGQSLAIIEYLDEIAPQPPLLPSDAAGRARVRQIALAIACDIHPLNNLRVLKYLKSELAVEDAARTAWQQHWIAEGFAALEAILSGSVGTFCHGDAPTLADICLIPQMANGRRAGLDLSSYPTLLRIEEAAYRLKAFTDARPENQPDAE
ncbi:MAG: maiA [Alphaproteobacteria bacterium]|jgi:maleylacetoacetate isomerase|nr:maiA [Alphaproteobacteria bacterium]MDB5741275.1 maiA [Alphaproteobacteria bacterium]